MAVKTNGELPGATTDHIIEVNRLGFRGELPGFMASPRIAVIGGSTVEDFALPESDTWVKQFEAKLRECNPNVFAANFGKGGVNARHHIIQLPAITQYAKFDLYVVLLGLNDFLFDLKIHHPFVLPADWWRRQAFMSIAGSEGSLATVAIVKRLIAAKDAPNSYRVSDLGRYLARLRAAHRKVRPEQWVDRLPELTDHLMTYRRTILELKAIADQIGKPIVFVSQPYLWARNMSADAIKMLYAGYIGTNPNDPNAKWYTRDALEAGLSAYNATLLKVCSESRLLCIDAASSVPREARYFYDDFHFSRAGAAKVGEVVARGLPRSVGICPDARQARSLNATSRLQ